MLISVLLLLWPSLASAFTLVSSSPPEYSTEKELIFNVANDTCSNAGLTPESLLDLVEESMNRYWNSIPTSRLKLVHGSVRAVSANGHTDLTSFLNAAGENNTIILGCNNDVPSFATGTLGIGGLRTGSDGTAQGAFLIYDDVSIAAMASLAKEALVAHELGHALGLGHSAADFALMYFRLNVQQESLSRDDEDGLTYLYPNEKKIGGLGGSCASVALLDQDDDDEPPYHFLLIGLLGFILFQLILRPREVFQAVIKLNR